MMFSKIMLLFIGMEYAIFRGLRRSIIYIDDLIIDVRLSDCLSVSHINVRPSQCFRRIVTKLDQM